MPECMKQLASTHVSKVLLNTCSSKTNKTLYKKNKAYHTTQSVSKEYTNCLVTASAAIDITDETLNIIN